MARATSNHTMKARHRAAKSVAAQKLIREHQNAARLERRLKLKMDQLYKKHPDLGHQRPLLHVHTYASGQKVFARWTDEFDRLFPAHHPNASKRDNFIKEAEAALPEHNRKRKEAGIIAAERLHFDAWSARTRAFDRLCRHTPRTSRDAGLIANYLLKALPIEAEGKVFRPSAYQYCHPQGLSGLESPARCCLLLGREAAQSVRQGRVRERHETN
jgi:hypothetical protein